MRIDTHNRWVRILQTVLIESINDELLHLVFVDSFAVAMCCPNQVKRIVLGLMDEFRRLGMHSPSLGVPACDAHLHKVSTGNYLQAKGPH